MLKNSTTMDWQHMRIFQKIQRLPLRYLFLIFFGIPVFASFAHALMVYLRAAETERPAILPVLVMTALVFLLVVIVAWQCGRWLGGRLRQMELASDQIRVGDDNHAMPELVGGAEIITLSLSLRQTVSHLLEVQNSLKAANAMLGQRVETRTRELNTILDISNQLASQSEITSMANGILSQLRHAVDFSSATISARQQKPDAKESSVDLLGYFLPGAGEPSGDPTVWHMPASHVSVYQMLERGKSPIIMNQVRKPFLAWLLSQLTDDPVSEHFYRRTRSWMGVPLMYKDNMVGMMRVDNAQPDFFTPERVNLLSAIGSQTAMAIVHARLFSQAKEMAVQLERERLARELHDAVTQTLFAANMTAQTVPSLIEANPEAARAAIEDVIDLNQTALGELRMLMFELRPASIDKVTLIQLLQQLVQTMSGRISGDLRLVFEPDEKTLANRIKISSDTKLAFYRVAQEAMSNVTRHSNASNVTITLSRKEGSAPILNLIIEDDGAGFDTSQDAPGHFGLVNMRERVQSLNGDITIHSEKGKGTRVSVSAPA